MRSTEKDRRELIQKLSKIKDPRARDKVLWELAGEEEAFLDGAPSSAAPPKSVFTRSMPHKPVSSKAPPPAQVSRNGAQTRRMLGFIIPAFFIIFGLIRLVQAALNYIASRNIESEIPGLIAGGIFLLIGLAGVIQAMRSSPIPAQDEES